MKDYTPLREKPQTQNFKKGDVLVLFGELFNRGYANGLVEEAEKAGMTVVRATVGRRDENGNLRSLTPAEAENIPKPFINIPLEAGFDMEPDDQGTSPNEHLKSIKLSAWQTAKVDEASLQQSLKRGRARFRKHVDLFLKEVEKLITPGGHVHFAHLMAGGVPRCKIVMPVMNWVFKGTGDRFVASETFWNSGLGRVLQLNFQEVTAETFHILVDASTELRKKIEHEGGSVSYVAYGYHGTEIVIQDEFKWQSYAPYLQGWSKVTLENHSKDWSTKGVRTCVYNCPEILTNSSSIFQGVEIPLYNLVRAFEKKSPQSALTQKAKQDCEKVLKDDISLQDIYKIVDHFLLSPETKKTSVYEGWPQHSVKEQLALTLETSDKIISLHKDEKVLASFSLSELIFKACGQIMLHDGKNPKGPVAWIGHDVVVECLK